MTFINLLFFGCLSLAVVLCVYRVICHLIDVIYSYYFFHEYVKLYNKYIQILSEFNKNEEAHKK